MLHNVLADSTGIQSEAATWGLFALGWGGTDEDSQLHVDVLHGRLYVRNSSLPGSNTHPSYFPPQSSHVFFIPCA